MTIVALASRPVLDEVERRNLRQAVGEARVLLDRDQPNSALLRRRSEAAGDQGRVPSALAAYVPGSFCRAMGMEPPSSSPTGPPGKTR